MLFNYSVKEKDFVRRSFLFGLEDLCALFRMKKTQKYVCDSKEFNLCGICYHECHSPEDFYLDLNTSVKYGVIELNVNDVIAARINGVCIYYRYFCGTLREISGFTEKEKRDYITSIHKTNKILNILDGSELDMDKIDFCKNVFYAIEGEPYRMRLKNMKEYVTTDYSLYMLTKDDINNANPYKRPLMGINAVMAYLNDNMKKIRKTGKKVFLLPNRKELDFLRDWKKINAESVA